MTRTPRKGAVEWAAPLANEANAAMSRGEPDDGSHYYDHWLAALEHLVTAKGLADFATLVARKEACADAYRRTPNGMQQSWPQAPLVDRVDQSGDDEVSIRHYCAFLLFFRSRR